METQQQQTHQLQPDPEMQWSEIVSTTAVISTVLQFLTGSLVCHKYIQKKSTGDSSGFPFICGFLSCSLWLCYANLTNDASIHLVNVIGSLLFFLYTLVYYVFTVNKTALLKQFSLALFVLLLCIGYIHSVDTVAEAKDTVGYLCCFVTVVFFAAPLTMLFHVIRVRNSESLPFPLIVSTFFVSAQWLVYGLLIGDTFVQVPNFLGCVLSGTQLALFVVYPSRAYGAGGTSAGGGPTYKLLDDTFTF